MKTIYLAGGCFWGIQKYIDQFPGVLNSVVGYANGYVENPTYEDVKAQKTGHTETVKVEYDESIISLQELISNFYIVVDPTSLNKQGEDEGTSYRCGIYYVEKEDLSIINEITELEKKKYTQKFVIEIEPLQCFYKAEEYHQKYLDKNPNGYCHIDGCYFNKYNIGLHL